MSPIRRPMADPLPIISGCPRGEMGHPGVNPSNGVDEIRTIGREPVTDAEIVGHIFVNPFLESSFLFKVPLAIPHFPNLIRGFARHLTEARGAEKKDEKDNEQWHTSILRRRESCCQQGTHEPTENKVNKGRDLVAEKTANLVWVERETQGAAPFKRCLKQGLRRPRGP